MTQPEPGSATSTRHVRIEYVIRDDVALDEVQRAIRTFVAGVAAHHGDHRYASYQYAKEPRRFVHIGALVETEVESLQGQPFFRAFAAFLRGHCASGPEASPLAVVASAR